MAAQSNTTGLCDIGYRTADDVTIGETLCGGKASYFVEKFLDYGTFAKVAMCRNVQTNEMVAVKILKDARAIKMSEYEVSIMQTLSKLDCDRCNVVKFIETFEHTGLVCLVFEMLDISLSDHLKRPLSPREIRPIAHHLLVALDALKGLGVIHTDLKADNVMYTNLQKEPYKVKLIDFGLSIFSSEVQIGLPKQAVGYRAPEVTLGYMFDEAIDMFGLGCVLAGLYRGGHLFPNCSFKSMKQLVEMLGFPPENMLRDGVYSKYFFTEEVDENTGATTWKVKMPENLECGNIRMTFDYLVNMFPRVDPEEYEDCRVFIDFLKGLMHLDPVHRLKPKEALHHPFITMSHLTDSDYLKASKDAMKLCLPVEKTCDLEQMSPRKDITGDITADNITIGSTLQGNTATYSVVKFVGEGGFAKVAMCQNIQTKEMVAVKILMTGNKEDLDELTMLQIIGELDCDDCNLVRFIERFVHMGLPCLVFELLDMSLFDLFQHREGKPLSLWEIRPIAQQLLVALAALRDLGVIHTDIKPDNVMLRNLQQEPYKVKLIDFGVAIFTSEVKKGMDVQPIGYRAPEVALGYMFDEAIDMWGLGCLLAGIFCARHLFPINNDYQMMKRMVEMLGYPPENLLRSGVYTKYFFTEEKDTQAATWRLLTPDEFAIVAQESAVESSENVNQPETLDDLVNMSSREDSEEYKDCRVFIDFLKGLLHLDPIHRLTPKEALLHPFITMSHLADSDYLKSSKQAMKCHVTECPTDATQRNTPAVQITTDDGQNQKAHQEEANNSATCSYGDIPTLEQTDTNSLDILDDKSSAAVSTNGVPQIFQPYKPLATTSPKKPQESPKFENIVSSNILTTKPVEGDFGSNHTIAALAMLATHENLAQQQEANIKLAETKEVLQKTRAKLQKQRDHNKKFLQAKREVDVCLKETREVLQKTEEELQKQVNFNKKCQEKEEELLAENRHVSVELEETKKLLWKTQAEQKEQVETNKKLQELLQKTQMKLQEQKNANKELNSAFKEKWEERLAQEKEVKSQLEENLQKAEVKLQKQMEANRKHQEKEDDLLALKNVELEETKEVLHRAYAEIRVQIEDKLQQARREVNIHLEETREFFEKKLKLLVQANNELEKNLKQEIQKKKIVIELQESVKKELDKSNAELVKERELKVKFREDNEFLVQSLREKWCVEQKLKRDIKQEKEEKEVFQARYSEKLRTLEQEVEKEQKEKAELRSRLKTASIKSKKVYDTFLTEKEKLLKTIRDYENSIESQKKQIIELSTTLVSMEEEKASILLEKENLNATLNTTKELRQQTGAALEQLVQLYDESRRKKRRFWLC